MKYIYALLFLLCCDKVNAQFNDTTNYFVRYNSTGVINKTNDRNSYVLNNAFRFSIYKKNYSLNSNSSWIYGRQQQILSNNDFASTLDFDLYKSKRNIYYWGLLNYEKSFSLKIDNRLQTGLGIGYFLIDRERFVFHLSDGILYEKNDLYNLESVANPNYEILRNSLRVKIRYMFNDIVTIDNTSFAQHSLKDRKDYILRSNTSVAVKLYKWLSITGNVTYNKLSVTQRENLLVNYGLLIERYF